MACQWFVYAFFIPTLRLILVSILSYPSLMFVVQSDGNYREMRYFTPWQRPQEIEDYYLESIVGKITGQYKVPFGDAVISTRDTCLGLETCEELFTPNGYSL